MKIGCIDEWWCDHCSSVSRKEQKPCPGWICHRVERPLCCDPVVLLSHWKVGKLIQPLQQKLDMHWGSRHGPCRENVVHMQFLCQQVIRSVRTQTWAALSPHSDHVEETWTSSLLPLHCDLLKLRCVSAAVDPVWGVALGPTDGWDSSVKCLRVHSHVELLQDALQKPWSPSELSALQQMREHKVRRGLVNTEELLATEKTNVSVRTKRSAATRRQVQVKHADRADLHDREIRMQSKTKSGPEIPQK